MPRKYDQSLLSMLYLPSVQNYFNSDTGRSEFMETICRVVDATGFSKSFGGDRVSCLYIKNYPYAPLIILAEDKFVEGLIAFRLIDIRISKRRAVVTLDGFPVSIAIQSNGSDAIKYNGLVLEQEYGGIYTGNISYVDPISLVEGVVQLDGWRIAIQDAGYDDAAAKPTNVLHTTNRYSFEEELKMTFSNII